MGLPEDDVSLKLNGWSTYTIHYSIVQQAPFFQIHTDPTPEFRLQSNGEGAKEITPIRPVAILPGGISCERWQVLPFDVSSCRGHAYFLGWPYSWT